MKRIGILAVAVAAVFLLVSCVTQQKNERIFDYQSDFSAEIVLHLDGQITEISYEKSDTGSHFEQIIFKTPTALDGYTLTLENGEVTAKIGTVSVPATAEMSRILELVSALFSLSTDQISQISTHEADGTPLTKVKIGELDVLLDSADGTPKSFSGRLLDTEISAEIRTFSPKN